MLFLGQRGASEGFLVGAGMAVPENHRLPGEGGVELLG